MRIPGRGCLERTSRKGARGSNRPLLHHLQLAAVLEDTDGLGHVEITGFDDFTLLPLPGGTMILEQWSRFLGRGR